MLTGLELMFMGVTRSNCGLFSTPGFLVLPVRKRGMGAKKKKSERERRREGGEKGIEKERMEGSRNKENRRQNKKEF